MRISSAPLLEAGIIGGKKPLSQQRMNPLLHDDKGHAGFSLTCAPLKTGKLRSYNPVRNLSALHSFSCQYDIEALEFSKNHPLRGFPGARNALMG